MKPTTFTCPDCGGVLMNDPAEQEYVCQIGHRYSPLGLLYNQNREFESRLWMILQLLQARSNFLEKLSKDTQDPEKARLFRDHAQRASSDSDDVRELIERQLKDIAAEEQQ